MFFEYIKNFTDYKMFSLAHILYFIFALVISIGLVILLKKLGNKKVSDDANITGQKSGIIVKANRAQKIVLIVCASIVAFCYIATQIWRVCGFAAGRGLGIIDKVAYLVMPNELLPFQLCNLLCFLIPFTVIFKKQWLYNAVAPLCIIGGFLFFFYPDGIINRYDPFSFRVMASMLMHTTALFYGLYLYSSKLAKINMKNIYQPFALTGVIGVIAFTANTLLAKIDPLVNYLYIRNDIFGLGLHPILTTLLMGVVFVGLMFAIYGVVQLSNYISLKMANKKISKV